MDFKLTVLIPCKDEHRNIRECIESVRGFADEILVADSGSKDDTLELVRRVGGCRIIRRKFVGYADFKNWAIPQAVNPWVLIVDADERVTEELAAEIRRVLAQPSEEIDGYWIRRRSFFLGREVKHSGWNTDEVCRLIRRDVCRYGDCRVHEEIVLDPRRSGRLRGKLVHYVYRSLDQYFKKRIRYTRLSAADAWEQGSRASFTSLLLRPLFRFLYLYLFRLGFLDGLVGIQVCTLTAWFNTFIRQARLWEMEHALSESDEDSRPTPGEPRLLHFPHRLRRAS
jgi:(heptosyl)LPS beta-1,4-glucosyltransferase